MRRRISSVFSSLLLSLSLATAASPGCSSGKPDLDDGFGRVELPPSASVAPSASAAVTSPDRSKRTTPKGTAAAPRVALGTQGAVASQEANASDVGLAILQKGGNAVDAAVAVGFALAVTHPSAGNLGGGGFMVGRLPSGETFALDYRETAPSKATRDMYLDKAGKPTKDSTLGAKAAGIPGTVRGFEEVHRKYGKLPFADVVAPAVKLAKEGFAIDAVLAEDLARVVPKMKEAKMDAGAKVFSRADGTALAAGDKLVQADLAKTLEAIQTKGSVAFYEGPLAETMVREVKKAGGIWEKDDLKSYKALFRAPISFNYRGHEIVTMPLPSAGGIVLKQLLGASEILKLDQVPWRSADEVHLFAEAMRRTYADRNLLLGDPDFVKVPIDKLLDSTYLRDRLKDIDPKKATPSADIKAGVEGKAESTQTTHYSVIDGSGAAIANTYTLNGGYGSKYMVPGTGVLLNNEMDDFSVKPGSPNMFGLVQGEPNKIEPRKRMLSSMTPTIIVKDGEVRAVLGSPGGPTISTTVAQLTRALIDYKKPLDEAVPAFRAHNQWLPDAIWTENIIPADVEAELKKRGHEIKKRDRIGHANVIEVDPETRGFRAVADTTRGGGKATAY